MSHRSPDSFLGPPTFFDVFPRAPTYNLRALDACHSVRGGPARVFSKLPVGNPYRLYNLRLPARVNPRLEQFNYGRDPFFLENDNMRCDREKSFARAIYAAVRRSVRRKKSRRRFYGLRHGQTARNYIFLFYRPCDVRDLQGVLRRQFLNAFTNHFQ